MDFSAIDAKRAKSAERKNKRAEKAVKVLKLSRKSAVKKADNLFSVLIRRRDIQRFLGRCPFDCTKPIDCCFHFVTRAKYSVRWDTRNAVGACSGHNFRYEFDPHFGIQWYLKTFGQEAYDTLIRDGNTIRKWSTSDLIDLCKDFERRISAGNYA